jgi:hypothetical protein
MPYPTSVALCIPRVEDGVTDAFIREVFTTLDIGDIRSVVVKRANKASARKAFINLRGWGTGAKAQLIRERLSAGFAVNIMYRVPWYWKLKLAYVTT